MGGCWRVGPLVVDFDRLQAVGAKGDVRLERACLELLRCFVGHAGETLPKETLRRAGWPGRRVSDNSLAKAIGKLRGALEDPEGQRLRVVHGYG